MFVISENPALMLAFPLQSSVNLCVNPAPNEVVKVESPVDVGANDLDKLKFEDVLELNLQFVDIEVVMFCRLGVPE